MIIKYLKEYCEIWKGKKMGTMIKVGSNKGFGIARNANMARVCRRSHPRPWWMSLKVWNLREKQIIEQSRLLRAQKGLF